MMNLLIVESPNKTKKIKALLGSGWEVTASVGHIRDLPAKGIGIDKTNGFKLLYEINPDKKQVVAGLKKKVQEVGKQNVYLATDPDREGEAIAYHLCAALGLDFRSTHRVKFQEITSKAVLDAIKRPGNIDLDLVAAQESRRAVDRLVGYEISPILWKKLEGIRSAGRVQSVAVRLCVERERQIMDFAEKFTFPITGLFTTPAGERIKARRTQSMSAADEVQDYLYKAGAQRYAIIDVAKRPVQQQPPGAFSTSALQQDASKKLKLKVAHVMELAQKLFEGGHITYMRTDSVNLSDTAIAEAQQQIESQFGPTYFQRRAFSNKAGAQEAHEAIRPTHWETTVAGDTPDQQALYQLIYRRAMASQMAPARFDETTLTIGSSWVPDEYISTARVQTFAGYRAVYQEAEEERDEEPEQTQLQQPVHVGDKLQLEALEARQTYAKPPKRFDEPALVAELERQQIGRPSTYASILDRIQKLEYVSVGNVEGKKLPVVTYLFANGQVSSKSSTQALGADKAKLLPTATGKTLTVFLETNFAQVVDTRFTVRCEQIFDEIAAGKNTYKEFVPKFDAQLQNWLAIVNQTYADVSGPEAFTVGELEGEAITAAKGKHGTYVKFKGEYFTIERLQPEQVTLQVALAAIRAKQENGRREVGRYQGKPIVVGKSDKGTYILWEKQYFNADEGMLPADISEQLAQEFIAAGLAKKQQNVVATIGKKYTIRRGDYGLYVTDGTTNAGLKNVTEDEACGYTEQQCKEVIDKYKKWKSGNNKGPKKK